MLAKKNYIQSGDAEYVQNIHSSTLLGTWYNIADADIHIKSDFSAVNGLIQNSVEQHYFALEVFFAICTQQIYLLAEQNGNGSFYLVKPESQSLLPKPKKLIKPQSMMNRLPKPYPHQIVVGPYGAMEEPKRGKFEMNLLGFESTIDTLMDKFAAILIHFW